MCETYFVQTKNYSDRRQLQFTEEGFTFNSASLNIFKKEIYILKKWWGGQKRAFDSQSLLSLPQKAR